MEQRAAGEMADADRRMTVAYVMNKMVPCPIVTPIAAALVERVYDIVNRQATRRAQRRSAPRRADHCTTGEQKVEGKRSGRDTIPEE